MQVWNVLHAVRRKYTTQKFATVHVYKYVIEYKRQNMCVLQCRRKRRLCATDRHHSWLLHLMPPYLLAYYPASWPAMAAVGQLVPGPARGRCARQSSSVSLWASLSFLTRPHRLRRQEAATMTSRIRRASSSSSEPEPEIVRVSRCFAAAADGDGKIWSSPLRRTRFTSISPTWRPAANFSSNMKVLW